MTNIQASVLETVTGGGRARSEFDFSGWEGLVKDHYNADPRHLQPKKIGIGKLPGRR
jgi:hypothetical protein